MTTRERLLAVLNHEKPDSIPDFEFGYWDETITEWHKQGLPLSVISNSEVEYYLGLEGVSIFPMLPLPNGLYPAFEKRVLEDKGDHLILQDIDGNLCEVPSSGSTIPRYLKYVIESRADWETFKRERLDPSHPDRSGDLALFSQQAKRTGLPIIFNAGSLYGWLRNWMGVENFSYALLSEKEWVGEMMDHLVLLTLQLIERIPRGLVDVAWWWEDMCYNHGPLMSPRLFHELMVPRYKEITASIKAKGILHNVLYCDGCIYELVSGWLESDIRVMFPLEAAHTDAVRLRRDYGDQLLLIGGVDKRALIAGREAIDREWERLTPLLQQGGFIPCVDHRVPPEVTLANYSYYLERKRSLL